IRLRSNVFNSVGNAAHVEFPYDGADTRSSIDRGSLVSVTKYHTGRLYGSARTYPQSWILKI
ncbi:MAG TPA: hypothetical protein PLF92_08710, partial [Arenimonas sp.]|nr:hypothetical protein [Arenimonas sp.]